MELSDEKLTFNIHKKISRKGRAVTHPLSLRDARYILAALLERMLLLLGNFGFLFLFTISAILLYCVMVSRFNISTNFFFSMSDVEIINCSPEYESENNSKKLMCRGEKITIKECLNDHDIVIIEDKFSATRKRSPKKSINTGTKETFDENDEYHRSDKLDHLIPCIYESGLECERSRKFSQPVQYQPMSMSIRTSEMKRKKRTREEIEQNKISKEKERYQKKKVREENKLLREHKKEERRIQREIRAAKRTKCEQYMFCHVGKSVFDIIPGLEVQAHLLFKEKNLDNQLIYDSDVDIRVEWRRKCIEATMGQKGIEKFEYTSLQHIFFIVMTGKSLNNMVLNGTLQDFVAKQKSTCPLVNSHLILVSYGDHGVKDNKFLELSLSLYENQRTQIRVIRDVNEMALYLMQISRGLAKLEGYQSSEKLLLDVEKGIKDGTKMEIVHDWWNKMLATIFRMGEAQRRAITKFIPDPLAASRRFYLIGYSEAVRELSELETDNGRRLGPILAHKIFMILTNTTGTQVIE